MGEHEHHPIDEAQAERGRAMIAAAVAQTQAPLGLRERIESQRSAAARPARRRWALGGSLAGAVAAAVIAIVLATGGGVAEPTVAQAAQLAQRAPTAGAPAVDPAHPGLLKRSVSGVTYPSWQDHFPWKASGVREDKLDGQGTERYVVLQRGARTIVTWRRGGHTCVLSGPRGVASDRLLALASWSGSDTVS
jgi:hypothetical protein